MSAANQPPSYDEHSNFQTQPPQNFQQYPQQGYPQPYPPNTVPVITVPQNTFHTVPQVTVVTQQPTATGVVVGVTPLLGPLPVTMSCPLCYAVITTSVRNEISLRTHCCALGLCLVGLWPCAILPYICGSCCQKTVHTCPNCNGFVGSD